MSQVQLRPASRRRTVGPMLVLLVVSAIALVLLPATTLSERLPYCSGPVGDSARYSGVVSGESGPPFGLAGPARCLHGPGGDQRSR